MWLTILSSPIGRSPVSNHKNLLKRSDLICVYIYIILNYDYVRVGNCLGIFFFSLGIFFWISGSHHFPCYLQHFGAGNCHFHGMCNGFEFEPLIFHCIFHGICNSLQHVLSIFHALCSIFELESAFPPYVQHFTATFLTVLAGFWS